MTAALVLVLLVLLVMALLLPLLAGPRQARWPAGGRHLALLLQLKVVMAAALRLLTPVLATANVWQLQLPRQVAPLLLLQAPLLPQAVALRPASPLAPPGVPPPCPS